MYLTKLAGMVTFTVGLAGAAGSHNSATGQVGGSRQALEPPTINTLPLLSTMGEGYQRFHCMLVSTVLDDVAALKACKDRKGSW